MPWPLVLLSTGKLFDADERTPIGSCWFEDLYLDYEGISPKYKADWLGKRLPLVVVLPGWNTFCVDLRARNQAGWHGDGWTVTGTAPLITLTPSINLVGSYHGFIQNGVITDDCEGRKFLPDGRPAPRPAT